MTNKPMLSVERELLERALSAVIVARGPGSPTERDLLALLDNPSECRCKRYGKDNPHWPCPVHAEPADQRQGAPAVLMELVENKIYDGMHIAKWDNPGGLKEGFHKLYAEQTAPVALTVWYGKMPESNGKSNWTAILHRKGEAIWSGAVITIDRSEYPDRVRYEADRMRYMIGELTEEPDILAYDDKLHSGYVKLEHPASVAVVLPGRKVDPHRHQRLITPGCGVEKGTAEGWNACLAEVAKLNGLKPSQDKEGN